MTEADEAMEVVNSLPTVPETNSSQLLPDMEENRCSDGGNYGNELNTMHATVHDIHCHFPVLNSSLHIIPSYHILFHVSSYYAVLCVMTHEFRCRGSDEGKQIHIDESIELETNFQHFFGKRRSMCSPHYEQKRSGDTI